MGTDVIRHHESLSAVPGETSRDDRETVQGHPSRWWRRIWRRVLPPSEAAAIQLNQQLAVLEEARTELEAGWVQGAWWAVSSANGGRRLIGGLEAGLEAGPETGLKVGYAAPALAATARAAAPALAATARAAAPALVTARAAADGQAGRVAGVCLVGALTRAAATGNGEGAGRAVDAVYDALWAARGQPATPAAGKLPPVPSPQVRLARVRTLTQWNDDPGRTKSEVLAVVDRAISATILTLAAGPPPEAP